LDAPRRPIGDAIRASDLGLRGTSPCRTFPQTRTRRSAKNRGNLPKRRKPDARRYTVSGSTTQSAGLSFVGHAKIGVFGRVLNWSHSDELSSDRAGTRREFQIVAGHSPDSRWRLKLVFATRPGSALSAKVMPAFSLFLSLIPSRCKNACCNLGAESRPSEIV